MFDATFTFVKSFDDPKIPKNFAPYGIQNINGEIWVTYTALNKAMGGFVDVFNTDGSLNTRFAVQGLSIRPGVLLRLLPILVQ